MGCNGLKASQRAAELKDPCSQCVTVGRGTSDDSWNKLSGEYSAAAEARADSRVVWACLGKEGKSAVLGRLYGDRARGKASCSRTALEFLISTRSPRPSSICRG